MAWPTSNVGVNQASHVRTICIDKGTSQSLSALQGQGQELGGTTATRSADPRAAALAAAEKTYLDASHALPKGLLVHLPVRPPDKYVKGSERVLYKKD